MLHNHQSGRHCSPVQSEHQLDIHAKQILWSLPVLPLLSQSWMVGRGVQGPEYVQCLHEADIPVFITHAKIVIPLLLTCKLTDESHTLLGSCRTSLGHVLSALTSSIASLQNLLS
ncbi:hypothetical protein L798_04016 [Zootermopsis nevadensis]|uniref:Uncharacterized protein n=1 Tax=Zootermopsis nevadensis TaxID=136037 RepID=A0A067QSQ9_ZOONE|nr:hypothetical protein L798_04016 [Zootermopsis nevadensis]